MPLSWNEIKTRAIAFSKEWDNTEREEADAKPFLVEFLNIFGIRQNRIATFEHKVKKLSEADGYIDLLWKGKLLVEMKSRGKDLDKAYQQAKDYCHGLKDYELPKVIMVCDNFFTPNEIASDSCLCVANASMYHFAIMQSQIHMVWVKYTCGRIKNDYRYSNESVYNNFPWPENPTDKQKEAVEKAAQTVLDARLQFPESSLADLYNPNTMPPVLVKAHEALDKTADQCYRSQPFTSEAKRIEYLFELYDKYTAGLFVGERKKKKK